MATSDYTSKDIERFWSKVRITNNPNDCWEWQASGLEKGYGTFYVNKKKYLSHRVSWQMAFGKIPEGLKVLHECDNPKCVNPLHLFLGTQKDNMEDMTEKGRRASADKIRNPGEKNGSHKLTAGQVQVIRNKYSSGGTSHRKLAKEMNIGTTQISRILKHESWKDL